MGEKEKKIKELNEKIKEEKDITNIKAGLSDSEIDLIKLKNEEHIDEDSE